MQEIDIDFLDDSLTELDMTIDEGNLFEEIPNDDIKYPCGVLRGIKYTHELSYLQEHPVNEDVSLPLYVVIEEEIEGFTQECIKYLCQFELTSEYLCDLAYIGKYELEIRKDVNTRVPVDMTPKGLLNFIKIGD